MRARWHRVRPSGSQAGVLNGPFSSRLCCWVRARRRSTRWTRCWWVRRDSCWFLLPCGEAKRSFIQLKRRVRRGCRAWRHQPGILRVYRASVYPSVFWAHAMIKHKSTDLECVMTELPGNSREPAVKWKKQTEEIRHHTHTLKVDLV